MSARRLVLTGAMVVAVSAAAAGWQKPTVSRSFPVEGRGAAGSLDELMRRSDVVIEGVVQAAKPADYTSGNALMLHTMYEVRVVAVYKGNANVTEATATIPVRRRGGSRDMGDRIEEQMPAGFPLFQSGERFIMFLREGKWVPPAPHEGIYYYGTTYDGPDSFFQVQDSGLRTHGKSDLARSLAGNVNALRAQLRRGGAR